MNLSLDIETYSTVDLKTQGLYRYVSDSEFDILLCAVSVNPQMPNPVCFDLTVEAERQAFIEQVVPVLSQPTIKTAFNAEFEWVCLSTWLNRNELYQGMLPIEQWRDTALLAKYCGLPHSLEKLGQALELGEDKKKLATGKALIRTFCIPRKPTKKDFRTRVMPADDPEKWSLFKTYCCGDVVAEMAAEQAMRPITIPEHVQKEWELQCIQNFVGVGVDMELVKGALAINEANTSELLAEAAKLTGVDNPNSRDQLRDWLTAELGENEVPNLQKGTVANLMKLDNPEHVQRVLEIRQETGKVALKKYAAIEKMVCPDDRIRGLLMYYGASRTGRWCLAEGTKVRVKTEYGEVFDRDIQDVLLSDMVWDGHGWVNHEGVVFSGRKGVIVWDGIAATPEHEVWVGPHEKMTLREAKNKCRNIWQGHRRLKDPQVFVDTGAWPPVNTYDIINAGPNNRFMANGRIVSNSGRGVQLQNLARTDLEYLDFARDMTKKRNLNALRLCYGNVSDTLGQLVRTALVPTPGHVFVDADFSAIEARVLAWLAGEEWVLDVFRTHGKIYEATASQMFGVPLELIKKGNPEYKYRQLGKTGDLACGYMGGVNAITQMDFAKAIPDSEKPALVKKWRSSHPKTVQLWYDMERAALQTVLDGTPHTVGYATFEMVHAPTVDFLLMHLPSGRHLTYPFPRIAPGKFDKPALSYMGMEQGRWGRRPTYGGMLTENITQAVARDILAQKLTALHEAGERVVFSVHDEVVIEQPAGAANLDAICDILSAPLGWAPGLPLNAAGWVGEYYTKD